VPLLRELDGLWKYRVRRFRIVYAIDRKSRVVRLIAVGHRRHVYEELSARLRNEGH
jgi:mRNA interferase RelE/StbE